MSLLKIINSMCPRGIEHSHRPNTRYVNTHNNVLGCIICKPNKERTNFIRFCDEYKLEKKINLNNNQLFILSLIFSRDEFYLPIEIRTIIFDKCEYKKIEKIPILLDLKGITHMWNCYQCSKFFIEYLDKKSCPEHLIPRINRKKILY